jgi:translation elongation factor EF-4
LALGVEVEVSRRGDERVIAISKVTPVVTSVTRHEGGDAPRKRKILMTASQKEKVRKKGRVVGGER